MDVRIDRPARGSLLLHAIGRSADLSPAIRAAAVLFITVVTAIAAQISIPLPFTPVPFTLQPMVVLLGAAALGARLGMSAQVLYLIAGIAGLPVFAASPILPQGIGRLMGPTGGYLMSYPFAAFLTGYLADARPRSVLSDVGPRDGRRPRARLRVRRRVDGVGPNPYQPARGRHRRLHAVRLG